VAIASRKERKMTHASRQGIASLQLLAVLLAFAVRAALAAGTSAIVDTAFVTEGIKRHAIIWDTRSAAAYKQGHVPGAVNIDDVGTVLRDENTEDYIAPEEIEKLLGGAGIDPAKEVIVYGAKANPYAYFALVTLQYFGYSNARIYHGGIDDWRSSGQPVVIEASRLPPLTLKLATRPELLVDTREVVRKLKDPSVQIVDARTAKEYRGEEIRAIRGGHIPGAIPIHYMENWVDPDAQAKLDKKVVSNKDGMNLKPRDQLQSLYAKLDPKKETIVYCQSGVRASETATILKDLGFKNVRVYDSSWLGYGNALDAPAESVTFFNVGLMQAKVNAMQKRIEALEKELAEARSAK
jgi:thiosulfate/3-mercaptopyruvate sulfurtransferase